MHAFPMRRREQGLGTLGLFGATAGALNADDLNLAKALAHVATIAILPQNATTTGSALMPRLQAAVDQPRCSGNGQGVLAEVHGLDMNSAFARLRRYARQHDQHLSDVPASLSPVDPSPAAPCSPTSAPRRCPRDAHRRAEQLGGPPADGVHPLEGTGLIGRRGRWLGAAPLSCMTIALQDGPAPTSGAENGQHGPSWLTVLVMNPVRLP